MKTVRYETEEAWMADRLKRITGTRVKKITAKQRGTGVKIGYWELIAERLLKPKVPTDLDVFTDEDVALPDELPMQRGSRLEAEALQAFKDATGKEVDTSLIIWMREDNENIALSPDGVVIGEPAAVENKCLKPALHIQAFITKEIPETYHDQAMQYFVVNDELQSLYFMFYNPDFRVHAFFYIEMRRADHIAEIEALILHERMVLEQVESVVASLLEGEPKGV